MAYTATDSLAALDATKPLGSEAPSVLDDAIREVKTVLKSVLLNHLTDKGALQFCGVKWEVTGAAATPSTASWARLALGTVVDPSGGLITGGTYTNTYRLKAGKWFVKFYVNAYQCGSFQSRMSQATGATAFPTAATILTGLYGNIAISSNIAAYGTVKSEGFGIITSTGVENYALDFVCSNSGGSFAQAFTAGPTFGASPTAAFEAYYLGAVTP